MAKIKVDGGDGHYDIHFVLFPIKHKILRRYLLHDRYLRLIGRPVTVTNVSPASILDNVPVLVAKQSSQLTLAVKRGKCNVAPSSPPPSQIEGIVTDDADADCGVYTLNRRKTLVVTSLCQVTNVRRLSKGQTVLVVNGHTVEGEAGDVIVACGRSYVADRNGEHDSVYASDEYHSIVNVALKKFLSYRTVLQLVQIRRAIITKFPEIRDRLVSCMDDRFTDELINVWDAESLSKSTGTSPLREFCCSEELHTCYSLGDDCESQRRIKCPASIANVKDGIEGALSNLSTRDAKTGARLVYSTAFSESIDKDLVVIGRIATSTVLGRLQIQDATESILLHVHGEEGADEGEDLVNEVVFLQSFVAVREELHAPGTGWDLTYLTVERRHIKVIPFFSTADTKLLQLTGEKNCGTVKYTVVNVSDSLYHANRSCVVACVRGRNGAGSRFARLYHSDLGGSVTVRSGTELVFAESDVREAGSKMFSAKKMELFAANSRVLDFKTPPLLKKVSRIRAKVYTLDELDAITNCEAVSIRGVLRQRWLEEDRFSDNLKTARKTRDPHIPNWLQLHLKISVDSNVQIIDYVSVYASHRHFHAYPLALLPGHEVQIDNAEKVTSERGHVYFTANCMTRFTSLWPAALEENESNADIAPVSLLKDLWGQQQRKRSYEFSLTLEAVAGLTLTLECGGCSSPVGGDGQCGFAGCHATAAILEPTLKCKAKLLVDDPTDSASLLVHDDQMLRRVLRISDTEWESLVREVRRSGEMVYTRSKRRKRSATQSSTLLSDANLALAVICDSARRTRLFSFRCRCRLFQNDDEDEIKLFAIKVF